MENTKLKSLTLSQEQELLKILKEKQTLLKEGESLPISPTLLNLILFEDETKTKIRSGLSLKGLDLSNISFSDVDISSVNFTGSIGAKINPQKIKNKDCNNVIFTNVEITGSFDDCIIYGANFKGSTGAKINPQKIKNKDCNNVIFTNVEITGSFDDCIIYGAKFKGSTGAKIDPRKVKKYNCYEINFEDAEITGSFDFCVIYGARFQGSKGAKIDPQKIKDKDCRNVNFENAEIIGSFDNSLINGAKFKGSIGAKINPKKIDISTIAGCDFADVEFLGVIYSPNKILYSSFEGSKNAVIIMQSGDNKTWIYETNLANVNLIYDEECLDTKIPSINLTQKYIELNNSNNILTETTTINGARNPYFLQILIELRKQFESYKAELNKSQQPTLKIS